MPDGKDVSWYAYTRRWLGSMRWWESFLKHPDSKPSAPCPPHQDSRQLAPELQGASFFLPKSLRSILSKKKREVPTCTCGNTLWILKIAQNKYFRLYHVQTNTRKRSVLICLLFAQLTEMYLFLGKFVIPHNIAVFICFFYLLAISKRCSPPTTAAWKLLGLGVSVHQYIYLCRLDFDLYLLVKYFSSLIYTNSPALDVKIPPARLSIMLHI